MNQHRPDEFGEYAGAYVLGALSPAERREFEDHLRVCPDCADAVQELAGLPGLLATVPLEVAQAQPVGPVPDTVLPSLIRALRVGERRRRWATAAAAAVVAAALSAGGLALAGFPGDQGVGTAGQSTGVGRSATGGGAAAARTMSVVGDTVLRADLTMERVAWGTRLDLRCVYPAASSATGRAGGEYATTSEGGVGAGPVYRLVVRSSTGRVQQVATWRAVPGKTITVTAATSWSPVDITSVQVQADSGRPLLQLTS